MGNAFAQNNVMTLLIGKDGGAGTPTTSAGSPILAATDTYLLDGEVAVVNVDNIVLNAVTVLSNSLALQKGIRVIQRSGTTLVHSDIIKNRASITSFLGKTDAAATQQLSYVGYNGSDKSIDELSSNSYEIRFKLTEGDRQGFGSQPVIANEFKSDLTASQAEVAVGLHIAFAGSMGKSAEAPARVERVVKAASITDSENIFTVLNGSKYVTVTTQAEWVGNIAMAAGDVFRIGTSGSGAASTDPAYVIDSISSLVITLDVPFQGVSGAIPATDVALVTTPTDWGLKFTGLARGFTVGKQGSINNIVRFILGIDNFGTTIVTYDTAASEGTGTYRQIAELEWFLQSNEGNEYRRDFMHTTARSDVESGETYDTLSIGFFSDDNAGLAMLQRSPKQLLLAFVTGFSTTEASDAVIETLENFAGQSSGIAV